MIRKPFFGAILALFLAVPAVAQTAQPFSIQGSLLVTTLGGDAFEGIAIDPGAGIELQARWNPSAFSIGAGFQATAHAGTFDFEGTEFDVDFQLTGFFVEPRYVIFVGSERAAPYLSARLMKLVLNMSLPEFEDAEDDFDALGWSAGGGVLVVLTPRLNLDLGLTVGSMNIDFGDGDDASGTSIVARLGLALGI